MPSVLTMKVGSRRVTDSIARAAVTSSRELNMETTATDLSAEISALHDVVRAALHQGLSPEEWDDLAQLIESLGVLIGDEDPGLDNARRGDQP